MLANFQRVSWLLEQATVMGAVLESPGGFVERVETIRTAYEGNIQSGETVASVESFITTMGNNLTMAQPHWFTELAAGIGAIESQPEIFTPPAPVAPDAP